MSSIRTARDRARAEIREEIVGVARRQLAAQGPTELSLRAVARELGVVPSAVYRYFDGRDALLTALIVEAYGSLADAVDAAIDEARRRRPATKWVAAARAVRAWAHANPHEYALVYGTPVPGYQAPPDTVSPGTRVPISLLRLVAEAHAAGDVAADDDVALTSTTARDLAATVASIDVDAPAPLVFKALVAWTQLFGLVSFELFHQTRGMVTDDATLFDDAAAAMAHFIGLR